MKTYHDQMDSLSFTDTQKAAMTDRLLTAANAPAAAPSAGPLWPSPRPPPWPSR